jgi:hypothetical protein
MAVGPFRIVCPIHFHFLHLICCSKGVSWARLQSSSFDIVFGQNILKIFLRHLFMKVCKYFKIFYVDFQVSHAKRRTDLTLLLKMFSCLAGYLSSSPHWIQLNKCCMCLLNPCLYFIFCSTCACHRAPEVCKFVYYLRVTPRPRFVPGKGPPVPIVQEAGWALELVWTHSLEEKSFRLCRGSNFDRPDVQPAARHYTDWAPRLTC